jgi:hypothetical protein
MNGMLTTSSNVYYLPVRTPAVDTTRRRVRKPRLMVRVERAWWRLRFMSAEIWSVLRRGSRQFFVDDSILFDRNVEVPRSRPRYTVPARVIDFESARDRLRTAQA